jgi:hypothetical protein
MPDCEGVLTMATLQQWFLASPFGINPVGTQGDIWHAGHVNDVLELQDDVIVVATDTGGVWKVTRDGNAASLSDNWENPDTTCLAFGPDGPQHIFAGTKSRNGNGTLWVNDPQDPFTVWSQIPIPDGAGSIYRILVLGANRLILIATQNGLWWAPIDHYRWTQAQGVPKNATCYGLAEGPDQTVVVTVLTQGIYYGGWTRSGNLEMHAAALPVGMDPGRLWRTPRSLVRWKSSSPFRRSR